MGCHEAVAVLTRGHDMTPTQTMSFYGEIPQIYHTFALFDPHKMGKNPVSIQATTVGIYLVAKTRETARHPHVHQTQHPKMPPGSNESNEGEKKLLDIKVLLGKMNGSIHPGRLTWNLKITQLKRKIIFQTIIFRFHVNLPGCIPDAPMGMVYLSTLIP